MTNTNNNFSNRQKTAFCDGVRLLVNQLGYTEEKAKEILLNTLTGIAQDLQN